MKFEGGVVVRALDKINLTTGTVNFEKRRKFVLGIGHKFLPNYDRS
jgi:hypothetical protein